jgi:hypothetical protein
MCYLTLLSTDDDRDLALSNTPLLRFDRALPGIPEEVWLQFAHRWYVGSVSGCSCQLRHLMGPTADFGFCEPVDWFPEEAGDIEATRHFASVARRLRHDGASVDCIDAWAHGQSVAAPLAGDVDVDLSRIDDRAFRFFENYRFTFVGG